MGTQAPSHWREGQCQQTRLEGKYTPFTFEFVCMCVYVSLCEASVLPLLCVPICVCVCVCVCVISDAPCLYVHLTFSLSLSLSFSVSFHPHCLIPYLLSHYLSFLPLSGDSFFYGLRGYVVIPLSISLSLFLSL